MSGPRRRSCRSAARTRPDAPGRLRTRRYAVAFREVWTEATRLAGRLPRWTLRAADARSGELRAEARTLVCRFTDDVVVRVHLDGSGLTCVDMVSSSRVGWWDFGTNARRIRGFLRRLDRQLARRDRG